MAPYPTGTCANCTNHGVLKYARRTRCTRYIERDRVNVVAKFDVDNGAATDLSLESSMYDGSRRRQSTSRGCCSSLFWRRRRRRPWQRRPAAQSSPCEEVGPAGAGRWAVGCPGGWAVARSES